MAVKPSLRRELVWALGLFLTSLGVRLALVSQFPTRPVSDFAALVDLAVTLKDHGLASPDDAWHSFNAGTPTLLALIFKLGFSADAGVVARLATMTMTALVPLLPFLMWRDVVSFRVRVFIGLLLALWPAHILFSGVVAQDNWVLLPSVALASLAVRSIKGERAHPIVAAVLWILAGYVRQEMWLALLPLVLTAGLRRRRDLLPLALVAAALFGLIATQRYLATGRAAVSTEHFGDAFLGTTVPDVGGEWRSPAVFVTSVAETPRSDRQKLHLAVAELARRPSHHLARILGSFVRSWSLPDRLLHWSLTADGILPVEQKAAAARFSSLMSPIVDVPTILCNGAFLAAVIFARRRRVVIILAAATLLKIGVHTVLVTQSRFFVVVWALELLTIAVALEDLDRGNRRRAGTLLLACTAVVGGLTWLGSEAAGFVLRQDEADIQLIYRVPLGPLRCQIDQGRLTDFDANQLVVKLNHNNPTHGDQVRVDCVTSEHLPSLLVEAAAETRPQRIERRLFVDDILVWHQLSSFAPLSARVELPAEQSRIRLEVEMLNDDPTWTWDPAGVTRLSKP